MLQIIIYFISQYFSLNVKDINNISEISEVTINKCLRNWKR